ncbi:MAG TPA: hypothetical protein PKO09_13310 [Anaerolineae bacterium]|nr:hypothetical protein [Anaerolineae bacterium]
MIEGEIEGRQISVNHVARAAQLMSVEQIHRELRAAQAGVRERVRQQSRFRFMTKLPKFVRSLAFRYIRGRALLWSSIAGTGWTPDRRAEPPRRTLLSRSNGDRHRTVRVLASAARRDQAIEAPSFTPGAHLLHDLFTSLWYTPP